MERAQHAEKEDARELSHEDVIRAAMERLPTILAQHMAKTYVAESYEQHPSEEVVEEKSRRWQAYVEGNARLAQLERIRRITSGQALSERPRLSPAERRAQETVLDESLLPPPDGNEDVEYEDESDGEKTSPVLAEGLPPANLKTNGPKALAAYHGKRMLASVTGATKDVRKWLTDPSSRGSMKPFTCQGRGPYLLAVIATLAIIGIIIVCCVQSGKAANDRKRVVFGRYVTPPRGGYPTW